MSAFTLRRPVFLLTMIYISQINFSTAQLLQAEYFDVRFSDYAGCKLPYYNGNDSIYLFDGCLAPGQNKIHLFTISSETIEFVAPMTGLAVMVNILGDDFGNMYYFNEQEVFTFDPVEKISTSVTRLSSRIVDSPVFWDDQSNNTRIFMSGMGSSGRSVYNVELEYGSYEYVATFSMPVCIEFFFKFPKY